MFVQTSANLLSLEILYLEPGSSVLRASELAAAPEKPGGKTPSPTQMSVITTPVIRPMCLEVGMAVPRARVGLDGSPGCGHRKVATWQVIYPKEMTEEGELELEGPREIKNSFVLQKRNRRSGKLCEQLA